MQAPLIAVAGYRLPVGRVKGWDATGIAIPGYYLNAVKRAGGEPAIVSGPSSNGVLDRFDALLLVGGGDVAPSRYGAEAHPEVYGTDPERDEFELALVPAAIAIGKPVLAICRGIQVLNVGLGGTLQQHLADRPAAIPHGEPTSDEPWVEHEVKLDESSHLAEACGGAAIMGRAAHHQAVDRLGEGLRAVGWTEDGVIEAIEGERGWVVGVQWHPERSAATDRAQQAIFDGFVRAARA